MNKNRPDFHRLFIDIETSPNIGFFWQCGFKLRITPENIIEERKIICISYKWQHEDKVRNITWDKYKDDKRILEHIIPVLNKADEIVYQNGDRFDLPWIKTRAIFHGLKMAPHYVTFDTLKKIKSTFKFNSNRLDYVQKFLGGTGKLSHEGFGLWYKVTYNNDRRALTHMLKYCDQDVIELEEFYNKIVSYVKPNTHVGVARGYSKNTCAHCGSHDIKLFKTRYTAAGTPRHQMICKRCDKYTTISDTMYRTLRVKK